MMMVMMFQTQNRETINSTSKVAVSFKIIMTTSVTRPCFTTQHETCKTKTGFWFQTGLVLGPTVSDHITEESRSCSQRGIVVSSRVVFAREYGGTCPGHWISGYGTKLPI